MIELLLLIAVLGGGAYWLANRQTKNNTAQLEQTQLADAQADARRWIDRLGHQVLTISGTDAASTQAMADASERYNAASAAISTATTAKQAQLARESALEGMHYVQAARDIMDMPAGPELPPLAGQRNAGKVTERRTIEHEGQVLTASPVASDETPNYYPGGNVAGRPVPAGWYSSPWWASAMMSGMWTMSSMMMFSMMFSGMSGVNYSEDAWAAGYGEGLEDGAAGDMGGGEEMGGEDMGGDMGGGEDMGGGDMGGDGGGFFGDGGLFGGGGDGGGLDFGFDFGFD